MMPVQRYRQLELLCYVALTNTDAGGEVAGSAAQSFLASRIRPKLSLRAGSPDYRAREQTVNSDFATSINTRVTDAAALDALSGWPDLRTVLAVESIRSVNNAPTKVENKIRYFLSSCPDSPAVLGKAVRSHWAVENALHWMLDVTFREDDSHVRARTAARNLALLRKIALNIVGRDTTSKANVRARRERAAWNDVYMLKLLLGWIINSMQDRHKISCVAPESTPLISHLELLLPGVDS